MFAGDVAVIQISGIFLKAFCVPTINIIAIAVATTIASTTVVTAMSASVVVVPAASSTINRIWTRYSAVGIKF